MLLKIFVQRIHWVRSIKVVQNPLFLPHPDYDVGHMVGEKFKSRVKMDIKIRALINPFGHVKYCDHCTVGKTSYVIHWQIPSRALAKSNYPNSLSYFLPLSNLGNNFERYVVFGVGNTQ